MKTLRQLCTVAFVVTFAGCAHGSASGVAPEDAAKLDRKLVRDAVVFDPGTKDGAVVPEISAPSLRAMMVPEHVENNRLVEKHREWVLEGDVAILGIPNIQSKQNGSSHK